MVLSISDALDALDALGSIEFTFAAMKLHIQWILRRPVVHNRTRIINCVQLPSNAFTVLVELFSMALLYSLHYNWFIFPVEWRFMAFLLFSNQHSFLVELACPEAHNSTAKLLIIHSHTLHSHFQRPVPEA